MRVGVLHHRFGAHDQDEERVSAMVTDALARVEELRQERD